MPNKKVSALSALAAAPATNDFLPIVDLSDTTDSANGTTKKITVANFFTTPTIGSFTNATHNHTNAAGGGQLTDAALSSAVGIAKGGTGQTTATAAFDALAPTTTQGDIIYHNGSDNIRLAKGTAGKVLTMNAGATAPEWAGGYSSVISSGVQASGAVNYAHGLGVVPKRIKVTCFSRSTSNANSGAHSTSFGTYDGTNTRSIYNYGDAGNSFAPESSTTVIATENVTDRTATATFDATNVILTWSGATGANTALLIESWS